MNQNKISPLYIIFFLEFGILFLVAEFHLWKKVELIVFLFCNIPAILLIIMWYELNKEMDKKK